ncbi:MAG: hypothetical protein ACU0CO_06845 [Shimia sp.]
MDYSINRFWTRRLGNGAAPTLVERNGWAAGGSQIENFVEPPLRKGSDRDFGKNGPELENASVILIAAPGAVGKTTFTREVSARTGAIRVDLSKTGAVGDNFLSGGLNKVEAFDAFKNGDVGIIIDALDEALLKTSSEGLSDFLKDVLEMTGEGRRPIVISGRTGSIHEAWLNLVEQDHVPAVVEIDFFGEEASQRLACGAVPRFLRRRDGTERRAMVNADREAVRLLIEKLKDATVADGTQFVGYAPVLEAIAKQVASYDNPQELVGRLNGEEAVNVSGVVKDILLREQGKVEQLDLPDASLAGRLYTPEEQIVRLVSRLYHVDLPLPLPDMSDEARRTYEAALQRWLAEHPFLDGYGTAPSSAVFDGYLAWQALCRPESALSARAALAQDRRLPNPFLSTFYLPTDWEDDFEFLNLADVPLVHASMVARVPASDTVALDIDGEDDEDEVDVQMTWRGPALKADRVLGARVKIANTLAFGGRLSNVRVQAENLAMAIGNGHDVILTAPIDIMVRELMLDGRMVTVEPPRPESDKSEGETSAEEKQVRRRVRLATTNPVIQADAPTIYASRGAELQVTWPEAKSYPWTNYATAATTPPPPEFQEAYGRMRKIVLPFKSDKYGSLAKYKKFVDHYRRTKGSGKKIRDHLLETGVIASQDHRFYSLSPERLTEVTGLTRDMLRKGDVETKTINFLREALSRS